MHSSISANLGPICVTLALCHLLWVVFNYFVLWSICQSSSFVNFKRGPEDLTKETCSYINSFDEISSTELDYEKFSCSSEKHFSFIFFHLCSLNDQSVRVPCLSILREVQRIWQRRLYWDLFLSKNFYRVGLREVFLLFSGRQFFYFLSSLLIDIHFNISK